MKLVAISLALVMSGTSAFAYCTNGGGEIPDCIARAKSLPIGHSVGPGVYSSGGTYVLLNAGCVSKDAEFQFHSAFYGPDAEHVKRLASNDDQMAMLSAYPKLVGHLISVGAFEKVLPMTILSGEQVHRLTDLPICENVDTEATTIRSKKVKTIRVFD